MCVASLKRFLPSIGEHLLLTLIFHSPRAHGVFLTVLLHATGIQRGLNISGLARVDVGGDDGSVIGFVYGTSGIAVPAGLAGFPC